MLPLTAPPDLAISGPDPSRLQWSRLAPVVWRARGRPQHGRTRESWCLTVRAWPRRAHSKHEPAAAPPKRRRQGSSGVGIHGLALGTERVGLGNGRNGRAGGGQPVAMDGPRLAGPESAAAALYCPAYRLRRYGPAASRRWRMDMLLPDSRQTPSCSPEKHGRRRRRGHASKASRGRLPINQKTLMLTRAALSPVSNHFQLPPRPALRDFPVCCACLPSICLNPPFTQDLIFPRTISCPLFFFSPPSLSFSLNLLPAVFTIAAGLTCCTSLAILRRRSCRPSRHRPIQSPLL